MKDGLSRRELMKALGALPLVGRMIGEVEAATEKEPVTITPQSVADRISGREVRTNRFGGPEGHMAIWIDGKYHGRLSEFEIRHKPQQGPWSPRLEPEDCLGDQYATLWWKGAPASDREFHDFTGVIIQLQTNSQRLMFRGYACTQSHDDAGNVCMTLRVADILELSSP